MTEREAFIEAIAAEPSDHTAQLAFADWLQEHGEEDRAAFIRLNHELSNRLGELGWPSSLPRDLQDLQSRLQELLERYAPVWLGPFCHALGVEPPRTRRRGLASRLWQRLTGKPRPAEYWSGSRWSGYARVDTWDNGPVRSIGTHLGLVMVLELALKHSVRDLAAALRLEPVLSLSLKLGGNAEGWRRLDSSCLARIRDLTVDVPGAGGLESAETFEAICRCENWSGVRDFRLWGDVLHPVPGAYFERLATSPLAAGLHSLSVWSDYPDLRPLTASRQLANLKQFAAQHRLPHGSADLVADAVFRPNLEELELTLGNLGEGGAARLAAVTWPKLHSLDLGELNDAGVRALLPLVPQLSHLKLCNGTITDAGVLALAEAVNDQKLESLWLSYNPLSPQTVAALRERFGERFYFSTRAGDDTSS